jgi:uncharacterized protein YndB with AHSA1/START domain
MRSVLALALAITWTWLDGASALALDEFDRHTSKDLRQAAEKNAAVPTLSSGQATKLKTLGPRIEHACVVVRTSDGNWAKALVSWGFRKGKEGGKDGGKDVLVPIAVLERYVTYDRDRGDVTLAHGRNVMLFPGYEFDFDIGQIVPADSGGDLRFTPQRLLAAIDKAKLHPLDGSVLPATPPDKYDPQDHADVRPRDFAGTWRVNADGRWVGTWEIDVHAEGQVSGRYTSDETKGSFAIRGRITETDLRHRLRFDVEFAAAVQQYDLYLWTTDKSTMAGTTTLISRTFGVVAERLPADAAPKAKSEKSEPAGKSAAERLKKRISLAFAGALEEGVAKVAEQTGLKIGFVRTALQAEGLTINKRVTIDQRDQPAGAVLRELLRAADPGGNLIYVVRRDGAEERIEITTRRAAERRGERLPPGLRVPLAERLKRPVAFHTEGKQPIAEVLEQFSRDTYLGVLVRWADLPAAEDGGPRRVELDAEKMPAGEVLRTLLTSAYGDGAIYVLANVAGEEFVVVTSREAAEKRGEKVPAEFAPAKS